jgi:hypothetical protein
MAKVVFKDRNKSLSLIPSPKEREARLLKYIQLKK